MTARDDGVNLVVHGHGRVTSAAHSYAHRKIDAAIRRAPGPILFAKVDLIAYGDRARTDQASAKAELDLNGRVVRAHADAHTMYEAIDELESRLSTRLQRAHVAPRERRARRRNAWRGA